MLVVEDNPANLRLVQALLDRAGYRSVAAGSLAEAHQRLAESQPDLVLLDIQLPDGDGLSLVRQLRAGQAAGGVPVVAVTAYAMPGDRERALAAGCAGYLTKPLDTRAFAGQVAAVLGNQGNATRGGDGVGASARG